MVPVSRLDSALTLKDIFFGLVTERKQCIIMPSNWIKLLFLLFLTSIFFISQQLESIYSLAQWLFDMFFMSPILHIVWESLLFAPIQQFLKIGWSCCGTFTSPDDVTLTLAMDGARIWTLTPFFTGERIFSSRVSRCNRLIYNFLYL